MGSKLQMRVTSAFSVIAALFLLLAGIFEFQRGAEFMALMAFLGMICALVIACHKYETNTQRPGDRLRA